MRLNSTCLALFGFVLTFGAVAQVSAVDVLPPPAVGDKASDFSLEAINGAGKVSLHETLEDGPVVLVMLRGYPGYQCPACSRQVGGLIKSAEEFSKEKATVVLVYPGPGENLKAKAQEFLTGTKLPENFVFLLDPDYKLTNAYNLRWDAERETAYPSTFVINKDGEITYVTISQTHGGRPQTETVVKAVQLLK
ncbi:peroxiredoxin family protein [Thalassoglobus sp. JC818]|uniref:peroxiredoxin family protein n=1 Tax=Thalassoglobus sp. JC818 TaxID=3232136 RepID=UPI00345A70D2